MKGRFNMTAYAIDSEPSHFVPQSFAADTQHFGARLNLPLASIECMDNEIALASC